MLVNLEKFCPHFRAKYLAEREDLNIVLWGDSLLAREQHTTPGDIDPRALPPLMHSRKLDWYFWQALEYNKPAFRRFDYPGFFSEQGNWLQAESDPNWDDSGYRPALTRFSESDTAAISWTLPADTENSACSFIDRRFRCGCLAEIIVDGGAGQLQVYDVASATWIEANGHRFSQKQEALPPRQGNTTYQRRLKLRKTAAALAEPVSVKISKVSGKRLLYWGVELYDSNKPQLTLVNTSRGSHTLEMLVKCMDNEVIAANPDLIILELPLLNMVYQHREIDYSVNWVWDVVWGDRPGAENDWALLKRAQNASSGQWDKFNVILLIPHHSQAVHLNPDGSFADIGDGLTAKDVFDAVRTLLRRKGDLLLLDMAEVFLREVSADADFPGYYEAMAASTPAGPTYSSDSTHQNDKGTQIYVRQLCPLFAKGAK